MSSLAAAARSHLGRSAAISFTVRGLPKAQPRPRAFSRGAHAGVYDPGTAGEWKGLVVAAARPHRPTEPLGGPVRLSIDFLMPRPKRLMRARDEAGELWCTAKPDRDNLEKAVLDALKQDGWFLDDALVCAGEVRKVYHAKAGVPGARITVEELEP
ncbi:MAG: RusA family crossover junction endodeoxyribonuclease [Planctomycetota bacterium]